MIMNRETIMLHYNYNTTSHKMMKVQETLSILKNR